MNTRLGKATERSSERTAALAAVLAGAFMLVGVPPDGLDAQERQGRQEALDAQQLRQLRARVQEVGNRALIGFKPADAAEGMRPDGTPRMTRSEVRSVARRFETGAIRSVDRQYAIIPAIAARIAPERLRDLVESPRVDYVEPDYLHRPTGRRAGAPTGAGPGRGGPAPTTDSAGDGRAALQAVQVTPWGVRRVEAPSAWSVTRGSGVDVGIIDTGIDEDHTDLDPVSGINAVTGGTARSDWDDAAPSCNSHGTHVAGTVAALDNSAGVVGVAPEVGLHAIRVFDPANVPGLDSCLALTSDIVAGVEWAVDNGMDVINLSLGSASPSFAQADALEAAYASGVFPVASAGNAGDRVGYPGGFPDVVAVAAIDSTDAVASFSNHGPEVEVTGPGVSVLSTGTGGTTFRISGTSMASPHAAGVAALIRAAAPGLGLDQVRSVLRTRAEDLPPTGYDEDTGDGVVRADLAAAAVGGGDLTLTTSPAEVRLSAPVGGVPDTVDVVLRSSGGTGTVSWSVTDTPPWLDASPGSGTVSDGSPDTLTLVADPATSSVSVHTGSVTIDGDASNAPFDLRAQFTLAREIPLDAEVQTQGDLQSADDRTRFVFSGTAGQRVDIAAVEPTRSPPGGVSDPRVILYMPDGETPLARNDDAPSAGLGGGALLAGVQLPEDGQYVVEVSTGPDLRSNQVFPAEFVLLAREVGPILGFGPAGSSRFVRAREGGPVGELSFTIFNLTGVGSLEWSLAVSEPWLSVSPGSGTASESGESETVGAEAYEEVRRRMWSGEAVEPGKVRAAVREELERRRETEPGTAAQRRRAVSGPRAAATVTLSADPAGFAPGDRTDILEVGTPADWLAPFQNQLVPFRVYDAGFEFLSPPLAWTGFAASSRDTAVGVTLGSPSEVHAVASDGTVGPPKMSFASPTGSFGLEEQTGDGDWIVGRGDLTLTPLRVDSGSGATSEFGSVPGIVRFTEDQQGNIFGASANTGQVVKIAPDGSTAQAVGPELTGAWATAFHPQDSTIYVAAQAVDALVELDPSDGSTRTVLEVIHFNPPGPSTFAIPDNLTVGRSGDLYMSDVSGRLWRIDPETPAAEIVALSPDADGATGALGLTEGHVAFAGLGQVTEGYLFPVNDGPARTSGPSGGIAATVATSEVEALRGDTVAVPLRLDASGASTAPASLFVELEWNEEELQFVDVAEGDFGGAFATETGETGVGILRAEAERSAGLERDAATVMEARFAVPGDLLSVAELSVDARFTELTDASGADLLPELTVEEGLLCVASNAWGDVDTDGTLGSGDAVQVLRAVVGLPLADGADPGLADVNRDGEVGNADAVHILRALVDLPVPDDSRVGRFGVSGDACP